MPTIIPDWTAEVTNNNYHTPTTYHVLHNMLMHFMWAFDSTLFNNTEVLHFYVTDDKQSE